MKKLITLFLPLAAFALTAPCQAACDLGMTVNNINVTWDFAFTARAIQLNITKANAEACNFWISFSPGGAGLGNYASRRAMSGTKSMRYQLYKDNALSFVLKDPNNIATTNDVITGGFQEGTNLQQTVVYYFDIPYALATAPTLVGAGNFTDTFDVTLYEGSSPTNNPVTDTLVIARSVTVTATVEKLIQMSLINSGGAFDLSQTSRSVDFGQLTTGKSTSFDLRLRSNAGYRVTFSSANNGNMKHTAPGASALIPYTLKANGDPLDLSNSKLVPVVGLNGNGQTPLEGWAYPINITIGNVSGMAVGGNYADQVTVTATVTE